MQECCRGISRFYDAEPARLVDFSSMFFWGDWCITERQRVGAKQHVGGSPCQSVTAVADHSSRAHPRGMPAIILH